MRKITGFLLIFALLASLCSCAGAPEEAVGTAVTGTGAPGSDLLNGLDLSLLPPGFPGEMPENAEAIYTAEFERDDEHFAWGTDFVRLRLRCSKEALALFSSALCSAGWVGGEAYFLFDTPPEFIEDADGWFEGCWRKGKTIAVISKRDTLFDVIDVDCPFRVTVDIFDSVFSFPEELGGFVPAFDGAAAAAGSLFVYDKNGKRLDHISGTDGERWLCVMQGDSAFAGVTGAEALSYIDGALADAGFSGKTVTGKNSAGNYITYHGTDERNGQTVCTELFYSECLGTLSLAAANDRDFFLRLNGTDSLLDMPGAAGDD